MFMQGHEYRKSNWYKQTCLWFEEKLGKSQRVQSKQKQNTHAEALAQVKGKQAQQCHLLQS